jgi:nodulation protein E
MTQTGVAVTGLGAVSAVGRCARSSYEAAVAGRSGIAMVAVAAGPYGPDPYNVPLARIPPATLEHVEQTCRSDVGRLLDSFVHLALTAGGEALTDAGLTGEMLDNRTAVIFGHATGGTASLEESYARFFGQRSNRLHPLTIPRGMVSSAASAIAMAHGVRGPVFAVSSACSSSGHAMVQAALMIRAGIVDSAIVGGSESLVTAGMVHCWDAMKAMSQSTCRPFSADRDGLVLGEGAAAIVLENASHARARGARIYAELIGEGCTSDSFHLTRPSFEGAAGAIAQAIEGRLPAEATILLTAHGTGTPLNDANEAAAINAVLGSHRDRMHVTATKGCHGHLLGASTALQVVIALLAARDGKVPPTLNYSQPDPACALPLVVGQASSFAPSHVLSNSFAFGGLNVALLFETVSAMA